MTQSAVTPRGVGTRPHGVSFRPRRHVGGQRVPARVGLREAMAAVGIELAVWTIHRRIGMSGGLMANAVLRETGHAVSADEAGRLLTLHAEAYARLANQVRPLPGARDLLAHLTQAGVPWAIATSGRLESARPMLEASAFPRACRS